MKNIKLKLFAICLIGGMSLLSGCYSFTGGSVPEHLKTMHIPAVIDVSGFGNPAYQVELTQSLIDNFTRDKSFELITAGADAKLNVQITSIRETGLAVSGTEIETERKVTVTCSAEFYDNTKRKAIFKKDFAISNSFALADALTARNEAINNGLKQIADDILLAVISGW